MLLEQAYGGDSDLLLGEIQYAYVVFLVGHSFAGFEQWKKLISMLCQVSIRFYLIHCFFCFIVCFLKIKKSKNQNQLV